MFDPYKELGLERGAGEGQIRKAYRDRAKRTHPDTGGSPEEFSLLSKAVAILSDPVRRKRFDQTGDTAEPRVEPTIDQRATAVISGLVAAILDHDEDPMKVDLVAMMRDHMGKEIIAIDKALAKLRRAKLRSEKMQGRFKKRRKAGDQSNLLETLLKHHSENATRAIAGNEEQKKVALRAIEMLKDYLFTQDAIEEAMVNIAWRHTVSSSSSSI